MSTVYPKWLFVKMRDGRWKVYAQTPGYRRQRRLRGYRAFPGRKHTIKQ